MKIQLEIQNVMPVLLAFCFMLIIPHFVCAQNKIPALKYLTTDNGLSQALNYDIIKDNRGFIWISSYDGLNRFDGKNIIKYQYDFNNNNSFLGTIAFGLVEDKLGNIWSGSNQCLNVYQAKNNRFYRIKTNSHTNTFYLPLFDVDSFVVFQKGNEFYTTNIYNYQTKIFFQNRQECFQKYFAKCFETTKYWVVFNLPRDRLEPKGKKTGLLVFLLDRKKLIKIKQLKFPDSVNSVQTIESINDSTFLLGTHDGLFRYHLFQNRVESLNILNDKIIQSISKWKNSKYIINVKDKGLYLLNLLDSKLSGFTYSNSYDEGEIRKNQIGNIFIDSFDNIFLSILGKGMAFCSLNNTYFDHYFTKTEFDKKIIKDQYISSMLAVGSEILVATKMDGIYIMDSTPRIRKHISYNNKFKEAGFLDDIYLFYGHNNRVLVTSANGIYEILKDRLVKINITWGAVTPTEINDIKLYKNGYLLSANQGLIEANSDFSKLSYVEGIPRQKFYIRTYCIGNKWLITCEPFKGFHIYQRVMDKYIPYDSFLINASVKDFFLKSEIEFWFASTQGLIKYNISSKHAELDNSKDKWINSYLYCLLPEDKNNLWISHNNGVTHLNLVTNTTRHFDPNHGLQGNEFNTMAFCKTINNRLCFGGTYGFNILKLDRPKSGSPFLQFQIEDFKIHDKPINNQYVVPNGKHFILSYNQNTFSINPILIQYNGSQYANEFLYKLEGIDDSWVVGKSNQPIRYSGIQAGSYTLRLLSKDKSTASTLYIDVRESFWKSIWFLLICLIATLGMIWFTLRGYYLAKLRKQESILAQELALQVERTRIALELHDDLGSGLTSISYMCLRQTDEATLQIHKKSKELIRNMNEIIWAMNADRNNAEDLVIYLRKFAFEFLEENNINVNFRWVMSSSNPVILGELRKNIYLVYKEVLHNIVKHSRSTEVDIKIEVSNHALQVNVQDNGIGLDVARPKSEHGNGFKNIQSRIQKFNGKLNIVSSNGTLVTFDFPLT